MEILGDGFLGRSLRPLAGSHPGVLLLARGVSTTREVPRSAYDREAAMVRDLVRHCRRGNLLLVFLSTASAALYGAPGCPGREDAEVVPSSPYGRHKLALEGVVRESGVRHLILRLSHVVGPHQPSHQLLPSLARSVVIGTVEIHRGAYRDLIGVPAVRTIVDALLTAGVSQEVVNVASGVLVTIEQIVDHVELRLGVTARREFVDAPARHPVSVEKLRRLIPDVADLGFQPGYYRTVIDHYLEVP
ncbi:NAD-dependent epimerase/dehydratase family protein [Actinophytocola sp.]|uniref:NAD-dependent epimerase/dehydratase family protein n=1 Tax=Actinophytocola sp. TaxID=1872138 RepID=UPI002D80449C|nr:NAD-dependent epimerase/dehydratase family protein [Actinophytocola sp.]HET9138280.1 NAD-dependent epimerase/dehydratase family protein [Actinophytocola sp.]HEU5109053.1 NAD-dependent epimerase/dehydratase family protein [Micromonosporaceae bacterium]